MKELKIGRRRVKMHENKEGNSKGRNMEKKGREGRVSRRREGKCKN